MILQINTDTGLVESVGKITVGDFFACHGMIDEFFQKLNEKKNSSFELQPEAILDLKNAQAYEQSFNNLNNAN
jgi:hypothetical protein